MTTVTSRRPAPSRHGPVAQLLIAWSPLSVVLLAYAAADWIAAPVDLGRPGAGANRLGFHVALTGPADLDRRVFGVVPSVWLQGLGSGGSAHWYDAVGALVYLTHFVAIPVVTALVWFRLRDRFRAWLAAFVTFTVVGVGGYVVYPAVPPWLASDQGVIGSVQRISGRGLEYLHLDALGSLLGSAQAGSNPVAAVPSLHAGGALLVALFLWREVRGPGRAALLAYVLAMALTLVYSGEHYVADVVAGWATAAVAVAVGALVQRGRRGR